MVNRPGSIQKLGRFGPLSIVPPLQRDFTTTSTLPSGFSSGFSTGFGAPIGGGGSSVTLDMVAGTEVLGSWPFGSLSWTSLPDSVIMIEWASLTGAATIGSSVPVEWRSISQQDSVAPAGWGISIALDRAISADWRSSFQVDNPAPVEWRTSLQFDWIALSDWRALIQADRLNSAEFGINIRPLDLTSPIDWLGTTRADTPAPADWRGVAQTDGVALTDWRTTTQVDRANLIDWLGVLRSDATFPAELLSSAPPFNTLFSIEWGITTLLNVNSFTEWMQGVLDSNSLALEFGGAIGATRDIVAPIDFTSHPMTDMTAPVDARASLLGGLIAAAEVGVAVRADAAPQAEPGASIGLSITPPAAYAGTAALGVSIQCDFMMTRSGSITPPVDTKSTILLDEPLQTDFGRLLLSTTQASMDAGMSSWGLWTSQVEWGASIGLDLLSGMEFGSSTHGIVSTEILPVEWIMSVPGLSIDVPVEWRLPAGFTRATKGSSGSAIKVLPRLSFTGLGEVKPTTKGSSTKPTGKPK